MRLSFRSKANLHALLIAAALSLAAVGCSPSPTAANGEATITDVSTADISTADGDSDSATDTDSPDSSATSASEGATSSSLVVAVDVDASSTTTSSSAPTAADAPASLPLPSSATELAAALNEAELAIRDTALSNAELDAWGRRQQSLYRQLSFNDTWADAVLADADPTVENAVALNWTARQNLSSLVNTETLHAELPAWRVLAPLPPETLVGYYKQAEADTGIQWEFLAAINLIETRMGRIQGISTAGAIGPMQFLPTTWAECCDGDPAVPADAIAGAAKYLTIRGGPENMDRAIFGYNNSDYYVNAVTSYANVMMENERAYYGYHAWEIYFLSTEGLIRIPVGYEQQEPIAAKAWLAENPDTLFSP